MISPEDGVLVMSRIELAGRLAAAGLEVQAREAMRRCLKDSDQILMWCETTDSTDEGASAGFHALRCA